MKLIRIMNEVDSSVPRTYLEKLGISTKRDDPNTIGQFGSGAKFAPIAALRNDWRWIFAGKDDKSAYVMEYIATDEIDGFRHVKYHYEDLYDGGVTDNYEKESSFVVGAGELSWDEDYQIFREAFANAMDEFIAKDAKYSIDVIDWDTGGGMADITSLYVEGMFCVYLTADPRMMEFVDNFDKYFTVNRTPVEKVALNFAYPKVDYEMRIFTKGFLAYHNEDQKSVYDYRIDRLVLNEERRMRDGMWALYSPVTTLIHNSVDVDFLSRFIPSWNDNEYFEFNIDEHWGSVENKALKKLWEREFGDKIIAPANMPGGIYTNLRALGYEWEEVRSPYWYRLLLTSGVRGVEDALGAPIDIHEVEPNFTERETLAQAMSIVEAFDYHINQCDVKVFEPTAKQKVWGLYKHVNGNHFIYVTRGCLESLERVVGTLIHELDHMIHDHQEHDAAFRSFADNRIGALMVRFYAMQTK